MSFNSRALEGQDIPKTGRDDDDEDEIGKVDLPGESGGDDQADRSRSADNPWLSARELSLECRPAPGARLRVRQCDERLAPLANLRHRRWMLFDLRRF